MKFEVPTETYKGRVNEVTLGTGSRSFTIGGENIPAFHQFEGDWPNSTKFALEVWDAEPEDWSNAVTQCFEGVLSSPVRWAQKCQQSYSADAIFLNLVSTEPTELDVSPDAAAALVLEVSESVDVPLIVYGCGAEEKDAVVLPKVAQVCSGRNLFLGPAVKQNFEQIGRTAQEHGHGVVVQTALEIPEAKELNVKLSRMLPPDRILFDPLSPALGYGLEYGYSVMEREKLAATSFGDQNLQMPLVANIAKECWDTSEAKEDGEQGVMWEAITGLTYLLAGANVVVVRHPDTIRLLHGLFGGD